jgi:hypothetical protein
VHPAPLDPSFLGARRDVIEDEFVRALISVAPGEAKDLPGDLMVTEANPFYDPAVADVEAGDDAAGKNGFNS